MKLPVGMIETVQECAWNGKESVLHRTFRVVTWPHSEIQQAWYDLATDEQGILFRVRHSLSPSPFTVSPDLRRKINRLEGNTAGVDQTRARDDELSGLEKIKKLITHKVRRKEKLVDVTTFLTISAPDLETLDHDCEAAMAICSAYEIVLEPITGCQAPGALLTTPMGMVDFAGANFWSPWTMLSSRGAFLMPWGVGFAGDGFGTYIGCATDSNVPLNVDFSRGFSGLASNIIFFGMTGEGKSQEIHTLLQSFKAEGKYIIVFDVDGEYREHCEEIDGLYIDLSGVSGQFPDPCMIPPSTGSDDVMEDHFRYDRMRSAVTRTFSIMGHLSDLEQGAIERATDLAFEEFLISPEDPLTWDRKHQVSLKLIYSYLEKLSKDDPDARDAMRKCWRGIKGGLARFFSDPLQYTEQPNQAVFFHLGDPGRTADRRASELKFSMVINTAWEWLRQNRRANRGSVIVADEFQRLVSDPVLGVFIADLQTTIRKWNGIQIIATNTPSQLWDVQIDGNNKLGDKIWGNAPLKGIFALEEDQLNALRSHVSIPDGVADAISTQMGSHAFCLRYGGNKWAQARSDVPPQEAALYKTRTK